MILTILRILFLRLRNNPLELVLVFVMPVVFFSIFAGIFSKGIATSSDKKLRVGWIAAHETALSVELRGFLERNSTLQCSSLIEERTSTDLNDETAEESVSDKEIDATIADNHGAVFNRCRTIADHQLGIDDGHILRRSIDRRGGKQRNR